MKKTLLLCFAAITALFCSCRDYNELNMQMIAECVAIDTSDDGVTVSVKTADTGNGEEVYTSVGESVFDAVRNLSSKAPKKLYWGHCKTIILGTGALDKSFSDVLDMAVRAEDLYLDAYVIAAKENAADVLKAAKAEDMFIAFANAKNSKRYRAKRIFEILREQGSAPSVIPCAEPEDEKIKLEGGAVINGSRLSGYINGEQTLLLSLASSDAAGGYLPPVRGKDFSASLEVLANSPKKTKSRTKTEIYIKTVLAPGEISGNPDVLKIASEAEKYIENGVRAVAAYAKEKNFGDLLGIGGGELSVKCDVTVSDTLGGEV